MLNNDAPQQPSKAPYIFMFVARSLALSVEVFLHRSMGSRALGLPALAALLLIPFWTVFWPQENAAPLLGFWWLFITMCLLSRTSMTFRRQGIVQHSLYSGWPRLKWVLPRCSERTFKGLIEPFVVFTIGVSLMAASQVLGSYLMTAALGLFVSVNAVEAAEQARAQQMHDALISQRQAAERFRRLGGDRF